jgi:hypothetical protein
MLHAFELGQLGEEERDRFELHLLSCDYCFDQVARFENVASLLRSDADVQQLVRSTAVASAQSDEKESLWRRLRAFLWPESSLVLKPALTYLVIVLLAYPAYVGIRHLSEQPVQGVQSLLLTGTRALTDNRVSAGQPLVVMFRIVGARDGMYYRVSVQRESGETVYENDRFDDFNDREMATLLLSAGSLDSGRYHIDVSDPDSGQTIHRYTVHVE